MLASNYKYAFFTLLSILLSANLFCQKKSYDGQGAVSEIIMASPAEVVGHFDLFFQSRVAADETDKQLYWYKIVFSKPCTFDFTLFPLVETDRYSFCVFKIENDPAFCETKEKQTITSLGDIRTAHTFKDKDQTESFRSNLIYTKKIPVKAGDAIYIVLKNMWGQDLGHIMGFNTCDYSYVLKVEKPKSRIDSLHKQQAVFSELQEEEALAAIGKKLCPKNNSEVKLGTINFNKSINVTNPIYADGVAKNNPHKKITPTDFTPPNAALVNAVVKPKADSVVVKTVDHMQAVSGLPKPEIWLKGKPTPPPEVKKVKQVETKLVPVRCVITDVVKGTGVDNIPVIVDELTGKPITIKKIKAGEYEIQIEKAKSYKVDCNAIGYKNFEHSINIYKELKGEVNELEIQLQPLVAGENFILQNIYFHANTPVIKTESNKELEKLYLFMKNNSEAIISIEGHTNGNRHIDRDSRRQQMGGKWAFHGTSKKLSQFRADEVRDYLTKKGVDGSRIKTKGWGGDHELYPDATTLEESVKNMRVEVVIIKI